VNHKETALGAVFGLSGILNLARTYFEKNS